MGDETSQAAHIGCDKTSGWFQPAVLMGWPKPSLLNRQPLCDLMSTTHTNLFRISRGTVRLVERACMMFTRPSNPLAATMSRDRENRVSLKSQALTILAPDLAAIIL